MGTAKQIRAELKKRANKEKAEFLPRFFKTDKGEYGYGDRFYGVVVPEQRKIAKNHYPSTTKKDIITLLHSAFHEERLTAIFIICHKFNDAQKIGEEKDWVDFYLKHAERVNNWDLVDSSAHIILGKWLGDKERTILYTLAKSNSLWKNRIAVVATWHFIRKQKDVKDILALAKIMLTHQHDLMHKATGWMLREGWKVRPLEIENFLTVHADSMPRTMLRYAIEKMKEKKRKAYLKAGK